MLRLRGSVTIRQTLAEKGAAKLWELLHERPYVHSLGAMTGNQAMQMARAGLEAIYLSGWQVAADSNVAGAMYPDQSLYPANSGPELCRRINRTLQRADQIEHAEGGAKRDWFLPIVADAEAGFGGPLNTFEIMKAYIEAGAAGVHFEDQLASEKKCGHLGGKVLIPTSAHERNLVAARLAADVMGDLDPHHGPHRRRIGHAHHLRRGRARPALHRSRQPHAGGLLPPEARHRPRSLHRARPRLRASMPTCCGGRHRTPISTTRANSPKRSTNAIPGKLLAYNCSPSFNWKKKLDDATIARFQRELGAMGYKFQFVTLAGFHQLNYGMFDLASGYRDRGMGAYSELQAEEFDAEADGYTATRHQREVGTGYFDQVSLAITAGKSSTTAMSDFDRNRAIPPDAEASRGGVNPKPSIRRRKTMQQAQFWVIGGEYTSTEFETLIRGTERLVGPFESKGDAERTWRYLSEDHRPQAQVRFTIAQEPLGVAHS